MQQSLEVIASADEWRAEFARLRDLCARVSAPAFANPGWLDAAWRWRAPHSELHLAVVRDGGRCAAFAPLVLERDATLGLPARTLRFAMVPDTQFIDLVAEPDDAPSFARTLAEHLLARRRAWDRLRLAGLSDLYPHWRLLANALRGAGIVTTTEPAGVNPYIDLQGTFDTYYGARSRSLKKAVNLSTNRLARAGAVAVDWVRSGTPVDSALAEAIRVSAVSWKQDTGNSLDQPGPRAFIERLTVHAARSGQLSIWLLRVDGKVIATEYQLIAEGNVYALRSDFDPAFADASPGTYLNYCLLRQLFGRGLRRYYMGPGTNAYKFRWTDLGEPMYRLNAYSPTVRGRLSYWLEQSARPMARRLRQRLRRTPEEATETDA